jgi:hypothetical protein
MRGPPSTLVALPSTKVPRHSAGVLLIRLCPSLTFGPFGGYRWGRRHTKTVACFFQRRRGQEITPPEHVARNNARRAHHPHDPARPFSGSSWRCCCM